MKNLDTEAIQTEDNAYIDYILANSCMPTLMRKKPSSMVSIRKANIRSTENFYSCLAEKLEVFRAEYVCLYEDTKTDYVFIYDPDLIRAFYCGHRNHELLDSYTCGGSGFCKDRFLQVLKKRFTDYKSHKADFPHEIGIFFGYPVKDVENYIVHGGKNYLFCGYWKVYDNLDKAVRRFRLYDEYKAEALQIFRDGGKLEEIAVGLF